MDWFERLTGFSEGSYADTRARLEVDGALLRSKANGRAYGIGTFESASLADLRERVAAGSGAIGRPRVSIVRGDVRKMHQMPEYAGALFQVASQFNALEMVGPSVSPEDGVTRYQHDRTQGPACALAAGAALIYRNFFVPFPGGSEGQTVQRQLDGLAELGVELSRALEVPVEALWTMKNGYCLCTSTGLAMIADHLRAIGTEQAGTLAGKLRIGLHIDVEVTDGPLPGPLVNQAFCSALPVAYGRVPQHHWQAFAQLVLDAAYEATLLAGLLNARRGGSNIVLLTLLGGGAFGNASAWIHTAIARAVKRAAAFDLDVRLVSYRAPPAELREMVDQLNL